MSRIKEFLSNVLNRKDMCALCLKQVDENSVHLNDETVVNYTYSKTMLELVTFILGCEVGGMSQFMETICIECSKSAINCYKFMEMCRSTYFQFHTVVNNLTERLQVTNNPFKTKTMFISIEKNNLSCKVYNDSKKSVTSTRKACKRMKSMLKRKKKTKDRYTCKHCLKIFLRSSNLRSHYLRVHAPKDFNCSDCQKKFGSAYLLKLHRSESHITVMCTDCGKTYNNIHSLRMHIVSHQNNLICPTCGKQYKSKNSFKRHMKLQTCGIVRAVVPYDTNKAVPDYRYECDACNKRFTQKGSLRVHINFEHENGKAYVCSWCNKKFSAQSKLKVHVVKHTRERNFTCEICGGKFVTKEALLYHTRIHTGEKPYPCPQCDERFLSASRRMEHLRRKHWGPTLECDICSSRFKTTFCLKKHKMRHFDPNSRLYFQGATE